MRRWHGCLVLALAFWLTRLAYGAPPDGEVVSLPGGTYRAVAPARWDGVRPLPLLLYIHGYGQSSGAVLGEPGLAAAATGEGVLLVVPDGVEGSWSFTGSPSHARDDLAFLSAVVADAKRRWPVDDTRVFAAGFSIGGSMVWDLACHRAEGFAAFLPVSGGFWLDYPARCEAGPVALRHVHGLADRTVPMTGRVIRQRFRQGDIRTGFAFLLQTDGCASEPDLRRSEGDLECEIWSSCGSGKELDLCLHPGDHEMRPHRLAQSLEWALRLAAPGKGGETQP